MRIFIILTCSLLFGCTQIHNTYTITGNDNVIRSKDSVVTDKQIDDMIRLNGSGYGNVQGGVER
jgi:hypothetical protein